MNRKTAVITIGIGFLIALGFYFWRGHVDTNQVLINKVFDLARKIRPVSESKKQDESTDFIKKIEDLLVDYTVDNDIKKTIKNFLQKTVGYEVDESGIQELGEVSKGGLSGDPLFFIKDKKGNLTFVVKVFEKPCSPESNFIREIAGFQLVSTMKGKHFRLISAKAIGTCKIDEKKYGLLAISPAVGTNVQDLATQLFFMPKGSVERANMLSMAAKALEKLGKALAEFHQSREQKNVPIAPAVIHRARHHLNRTLEQLKDDNYGVDLQMLQQYFDYLVERLKKANTTRSIIHADAHLGNYLYDPKTGVIFFVDYNSLHRVADQEGNPIWHAAFDFMNVLEAIEISLKFGFSEQEYGTARDAFIKGYGSLPTKLEQEFFALFCHLRLAGWFLRMEKERPEQFSNEKMKAIPRLRLEAIKELLSKFKESKK